ncbi:MAG: hypothetical protein QM765_33320 [Myxococcales bacterium]
MKKIDTLGARGFLYVLGSLAALAGAAACPYGPVPERTCTEDVDCKTEGTGWYCVKSTGHCAYAGPDAGVAGADAGTAGEDAGK